MNLLRRHPIAITLVALVLLSSFTPLPPLVDAVSGASPPDADLVRPTLYTVLAPISNLLDALTFLTVERAKALLFTWMAVLALWTLWELRRRVSLAPRLLAAALATLVVPLAGVAAVLLPRPVPRLVTTDSSFTVIDYHAHTAASHDGRHGWTLADLASWHAAQGFEASYVTDHNIVFDRPPLLGDAIRLLPGVEWSVDGQHIVALGGVAPVDRAAFSRDTRAALGLFAELHREGAIGIASLPEYWRNAWDDVDAFVAAGVDGFEIVNCAPKAIGFPATARERIVALAASHDLLVVGATDNHGWGKVTCLWNLSSPGAHGYRANRVVARPIALAQADWQPWTAGFTQPWLMLQGLSLSERSSWLTWILVILIYRAVPRRAGDPGGIGILARSLSLKILKLKRPAAS
ncbi:MAG TPA: hypothetical protein VJN39_11385 [Gemmatimonadales bacterium]|nr:hypothetical protein [Gemmatimonadales bacterium]